MSASDELREVIRYLMVVMPDKIQKEMAYGAQAVQAKTVIDARVICPTGVAGTLSQSIQEGPITISDNGSIEAVVEANADYASYVEWGTRPHFPPVEALKDWAAKFLGDEKLAFLVARAISRRGTRPYNFMGQALLQNTPVFFSAMAAAVGRALDGLKT